MPRRIDPNAAARASDIQVAAISQLFMDPPRFRPAGAQPEQIRQGSLILADGSGGPHHLRGPKKKNSCAGARQESSVRFADGLGELHRLLSRLNSITPVPLG